MHIEGLGWIFWVIKPWVSGKPIVRLLHYEVYTRDLLLFAQGSPGNTDHHEASTPQSRKYSPCSVLGALSTTGVLYAP